MPGFPVDGHILDFIGYDPHAVLLQARAVKELRPQLVYRQL